MNARRLLSLILSLCIVLSAAFVPTPGFASDNPETKRTVYLHAQGTNPDAATKEWSTAYVNETVDIYLAVDDANKGEYDAASDAHLEPQYDMSGYTVKIYYDPYYFSLADGVSVNKPIDFTVPDKQIASSGEKDETVGDDTVTTPRGEGYNDWKHGSGTETVGGKEYKTAYIILFMSGGFFPQKSENQSWYNLLKLPLKPLRTGYSEVFIDELGYADDGYKLELRATNDKSDAPEDQIFECSVKNAGKHGIYIENKNRPATPTASPAPGEYTRTQEVVLSSAEPYGKIFYSTDKNADKSSYEPYTAPITVSSETTIYTYVKRTSDNQESNIASYHYDIVPHSPYLFDENEMLITNTYSRDNVFTVKVSDKAVFGQIEDDSEVYYTFAKLDETAPLKNSGDANTEWVKLVKGIPNQTIDIKNTCTLRLITKKMNKLSAISEYNLGISPARVEAEPKSGVYDTKRDIALSTKTVGAKIFYTIDGTDPVANGIEYSEPISVVESCDIKAVAVLGSYYSPVDVFSYIINRSLTDAITAYNPPGVYKGSVSVSLTPKDPDYKVKYSVDDGKSWNSFDDEKIVLYNDTTIKAQVYKEGDNEEKTVYTFKYTVRPQDPVFAPEGSQISSKDKVSIYCIEGQRDGSEDEYLLYYTTDDSDPANSKNPNRIKADSKTDMAAFTIGESCNIRAVVEKTVNGKTSYSEIVNHYYELVDNKPVKPVTELTPGYYLYEIDSLGYTTRFAPVANGMTIYYTISSDGSFVDDPEPDADGTIKYKEGNPIPIVGRTTIKAICVNALGIKSDVAVFNYTVVPGTSRAVNMETFSSAAVPRIKVQVPAGTEAVYRVGSDGDLKRVSASDGIFYVDIETGDAYTASSGGELLEDLNAKAKMRLMGAAGASDEVTLYVYSILNGVESTANTYRYIITDNDDNVMPVPHADYISGTYEEINFKNSGHFLEVSLDIGTTSDAYEIEYRLSTDDSWTSYSGPIAIDKDCTLYARSSRTDGKKGYTISYSYHFVPPAPIITLPEGRYSKDDSIVTQVLMPDNIINSDSYKLYVRRSGDKADNPYVEDGTGVTLRKEDVSIKAYLVNSDGIKGKSAIHYYHIDEGAGGAVVTVAPPFNQSTINPDLLATPEYNYGEIKLLPENTIHDIQYEYSYVKIEPDGSERTIDISPEIYDRDDPIKVNASYKSITIKAWLADRSTGAVVSDITEHTISFVRPPKDETGTKPPQYSGGGGGSIIEAKVYTKDIFGDEHPTHISYINGYPDGSVQADGNVTREEAAVILYRIDKKHYQSPFVPTGDIFPDVDISRWSVMEIEYMADKKVIEGYPEGDFVPRGNLTRAEFAALIRRFTSLGKAKKAPSFNDLEKSHWAYEDIASLASAGLIQGYEDGSFRPQRAVTRAEFVTVVNKLLGRCPSKEYLLEQSFNPFNDLDSEKWYYEAVLEATITHDYELNKKHDLEIKWENTK